MHCTTYIHKNQLEYHFTSEADIFEVCAEKDRIGLEYLFRVLYHFEQIQPVPGHFRYCITNDLRELPEYGPDVVVLLMWDEWCRIPRYAHRVGHVLSTYGFEHFSYVSRPVFSMYNALKFFKSLWIEYNRLPFTLHFYLHNRPADRHRRLHPVPLGYYKHEKLPIVPIENRAVDVHFAGSIYADASKTQNRVARFFKNTLTSPRNYARRKLVESLTAVQQNFPEFNIVNRFLAQFGAGLSRAEYSAELGNTKICLIPRGSSLDTYRLCEAMRSGCVLICDRLPGRWCYDGIPALFVDDWSELESVLVPLLRDPARLRQLHEQTLAWWHDRCSPAAVAAHLQAAVAPAEAVDLVVG